LIIKAIKINNIKNPEIPKKENLLVVFLKITIKAANKTISNPKTIVSSALKMPYGPNKTGLNKKVLKGLLIHGEYRSERKR